VTVANFRDLWSDGKDVRKGGRDLVPAPRPAAARPAAPRVRARYDAAQTTEENRRHWTNADNLSANAEHTTGVRRTLRNRARYECMNNAYAGGLVQTLSHDLVGTGPRLSLDLGDGAEDLATSVEVAFAQWATRVNLADTLRILHESRIRDGEGFAILTNGAPGGPGDVSLDVKPVEADQIESPLLDPFDPLMVDGIRFDAHGKPVEYHVLQQHPADNRGLRTWGAYLKVPAGTMLHWFRPSRPGQARGVPEITAVLPLFAQLRRYTLAVLTAAETAAMIAGVMKTNAPADPDTPQPAAMDRVEFERGALLTLPEGWDASGFQPTQPVTTYGEFKAEILNEIGRALNVPYNVVAGNSSKYNYSSGRLDYLIYHRTCWVERERMRFAVLDRIFRAFINEARLVPGLLPAGLPAFALWRWEWHWDGFGSIDPQKDGAADAAALAAGLMTWAEFYAKQGQDWKAALRQRAREKLFMAGLGLDAAAPSTPPPADPTDTPPEGPADA
jgi:lambda family phage portal protein